MSKYTTQLRWPIEQKLDSLELDHSEVNWPQCYEMIGLSDYPLFDEDYREGLTNKIIRAYYFREIGFETVAQFSWQMRRLMFEIMPYYNQLYQSEGLITDPLYSTNMDYTETWTRDESTNRDTTMDDAQSSGSKTETSASSDDRNVYQDTPMNGLDTGAIESMDYATNVTYDSSTSTGSSGTETSSTDNRTTADKYTGDYDGTKQHNQKGYDGSQADLLLTYRKTFLNIDLEIVKRLDVLFMQIW